MTGFILEEGPLHCWEIEEGVIYHCRFSLSGYTRSLFNEYKLPFPEGMQQAVKKRQAEYLAGRYCAQTALKHIGLYVSEIPSGKNREPLWPYPVVGAITHNMNAAAACVTKNANISGLGIDLENIIQSETMENIQGSILTSADFKLLSGQSNQELAFTVIFSLKESFFKAAFLQVGKYFDFDAVDILELDSENEVVRYKLNYELSPGLQKNMEFTGNYQVLDESKVMTFVKLKR